VLSLYKTLGKNVGGFYLSSLNKLKDTKSPSVDSTLLIELVKILKDDQDLFLWIDTCTRAMVGTSGQGVAADLIGMLHAFPEFIDCFCTIDVETSTCDDKLHKLNLESFMQTTKKYTHILSKKKIRNL